MISHAINHTIRVYTSWASIWFKLKSEHRSMKFNEIQPKWGSLLNYFGSIKFVVRSPFHYTYYVYDGWRMEIGYVKFNLYIVKGLFAHFSLPPGFKYEHTFTTCVCVCVSTTIKFFWMQAHTRTWRSNFGDIRNLINTISFIETNLYYYYTRYGFMLYWGIAIGVGPNR